MRVCVCVGGFGGGARSRVMVWGGRNMGGLPLSASVSGGLGCAYTYPYHVIYITQRG
jgi:hypothetical protein